MKCPTTRPRLMLADDHTILIEALCKLLEPYRDVVATVADGRSLLEVAPRINPEVIIVDITVERMGAGRGFTGKPVVSMDRRNTQLEPTLH